MLWTGAGVKDERAELTKDAASQPGGWGPKGRVMDLG